jgi:pimeloyl-ACP methyl ester carboxylesterase
VIRVAGSGPPVLLLHGAEADHRMFDRLVGLIADRVSALVPLDHARALASEFPNAQLVIVPGVGHVIPLQAPALPAAHITEFIGRSP